uniref:ABC transporter permease n=1 Tax=Ndongobacter massiliensis TaxID=1871025 RepID=UPI0009304EBD|nr:ABC transporter permease [Ndongobacter massiliensis]
MKYVLRRILYMIPTLVGVTLIIFTLLHFSPGSPAVAILGENSSPEKLEQMEEEMGLNDPFFVQYGRYLKKLVFEQDLGNSYRRKDTVANLLADAFPTTARLATLSVLVATVIGVPLGILAAVKRYSIFDVLTNAFGLFGLSIPVFWLAMMLIILFATMLHWLPPSGFSTPQQMVLPVVSLSLQSVAIIMRMTRSAMLEVLGQDYIRTATAKGLRTRSVIVIHALKNAFIPVLTSIGLQFGSLMGGAVLTESIFSIAGVGRLMLDAIRMRDYPVVQGCVLVIAVCYCLINLIVDLLYGALDPRIRARYR